MKESYGNHLVVFTCIAMNVHKLMGGSLRTEHGRCTPVSLDEPWHCVSSSNNAKYDIAPPLRPEVSLQLGKVWEEVTCAHRAHQLDSFHKE
jgi:hypothetical protein